MGEAVATVGLVVIRVAVGDAVALVGEDVAAVGEEVAKVGKAVPYKKIPITTLAIGT